MNEDVPFNFHGQNVGNFASRCHFIARMRGYREPVPGGWPARQSVVLRVGESESIVGARAYIPIAATPSLSYPSISKGAIN
ncbi:unnamed protein product [Colias eurytheme]|nr:unnamed protein product [Colias eurytheme]